MAIMSWLGPRPPGAPILSEANASPELSRTLGRYLGEVHRGTSRGSESSGILGSRGGRGPVASRPPLWAQSDKIGVLRRQADRVHELCSTFMEPAGVSLVMPDLDWSQFVPGEAPGDLLGAVDLDAVVFAPPIIDIVNAELVLSGVDEKPSSFDIAERLRFFVEGYSSVNRPVKGSISPREEEREVLRTLMYLMDVRGAERAGPDIGKYEMPVADAWLCDRTVLLPTRKGE
jgi:hypothetical protein